MKKNILLSGILLLLFCLPLNARPVDQEFVGKGYSKYHNIHRHYPANHPDDVKLVKKFARK